MPPTLQSEKTFLIIKKKKSGNKPRKRSSHSAVLLEATGASLENRVSTNEAPVTTSDTGLIFPSSQQSHIRIPQRLMSKPVQAGGQSWDSNPGPCDSKSCALSTKPWLTWTGCQLSPPLPTKVAAAPDPKPETRFLLPPLLDPTHWYTVGTAPVLLSITTAK